MGPMKRHVDLFVPFHARPIGTGNRAICVDTPAGPVTEWSESYRAATVKVAKRFAGTYEVFTGVRNLTNEGQEKMNPVAPRAYFGGVGAEI